MHACLAACICMVVRYMYGKLRSCHRNKLSRGTFPTKLHGRHAAKIQISLGAQAGLSLSLGHIQSCSKCCAPTQLELQDSLNGSNPDGSFTVDDSNSFFSPYKILPIAQNKYLGTLFLNLSWNCMLCVLIRIASSRRF